MKEIFKSIKGFKDYQISNLGRVKSLKFDKQRILKQSTNKKGYLQVGLMNQKKEYKKRVHILVAEAFLNHLTDNQFNLIVDHKNNIKTDNKVSNLQILTIRDNSSKDQFRHNRTSKHIGVSFKKNKKRWIAQIMIGKTSYYLGQFLSEKEAGIEYIKALYHLERNIDRLDNYHFEKSPKKHKKFLSEMHHFFIADNL